MARGCYCPHCGEYEGKSVEVPIHVKCSNCGKKYYNEEGEAVIGGWNTKEKDEAWANIR